MIGSGIPAESAVKAGYAIIDKLPVVLMNILGGIVFARIVFRNMMKRTRKEIPEDLPSGDEPGQRGSPPTVTFTEIGRGDAIEAVSREAVRHYRVVTRINNIKYAFIIGNALFLLLTFVLLPAVKTKRTNDLAFCFAVYFAVLNIGLIAAYISHLVRSRAISKSLVVLRVFGSKSNTQFLFNRMAFFWNYIGSSFTIMDPVFARFEFTVFGSPRNLLLKAALIVSVIAGVFVGQLSVFGNYFMNYLAMMAVSLALFILFLFIITPFFFIRDIETLRDRIGRNANFGKRWYGRGKQVNLYCFDNIWKHALREMLDRASVVVMDLRGFSDERKGCSYEMSYLARHFDMDRTLFLINKKTDTALVRRTLENEAAKIDGNSSGKDTLNVTFFDCTRQSRRNTKRILRILCNKIAAREETAGTSEKLSFTPTLSLVRLRAYIVFPVFFTCLILALVLSSFTIARLVQENLYAGSQDIAFAPPPEPLAAFELPEFTMATNDAEPHFVKMTIALAYEKSPELENELASRSDQIRHIVTVIMQGKSYNDLDSVEDKFTLSDEIKAHVNVILMSGKIKEIYFKEMIVN